MEMAATVYLFLLAIPFVSGTFSLFNQNGSPSKIRPKLSYQHTFEFSYPKISIRQPSMDECLRRYPYTYDVFKCHPYFRRIREYLKPKLESNTLRAGKLLPEILNENNKQMDKPERYINSVLDEDNRDASNFNASDNVLNSTWIEIKDPRKITITLKSKIANAEKTDAFVSSAKKNISTGNESNPSIAEEKGIGTKDTATDGSNTDGETTTEIQQQTTAITETSDVVTSGEIDERTPTTIETSDVSLINEVTGGKTTAKQDPISTADMDEENKTNTYVEKGTNSVSSSENREKSTTEDLRTDSATYAFKETTENRIVNETNIEITTGKGSAVKSFSTEENLSTESRSTLTSVVPENLNNNTTLETADFTTSTVFITTLHTALTRSEPVSVSDADISRSSETESAISSSTVTFPSVSVTKSSEFSTESGDGGLTSTMITDSKSSNGDYVTKSIAVVPEHTINIRSIKTAKIVLSVLLLVTGLIAVVMLAVYLFRVRRGAVQYDQLTLLP